MKIDIVVFDGMDELDAVAPLEVSRRADFDVHLVGLAARVTCAYGLQIPTDGPPRDEAELIIFPGGGWVARRAEGVRAEVDAARWVPLIQDAAERIADSLEYRATRRAC